MLRLDAPGIGILRALLALVVTVLLSRPVLGEVNAPTRADVAAHSEQSTDSDASGLSAKAPDPTPSDAIYVAVSLGLASTSRSLAGDANTCGPAFDYEMGIRIRKFLGIHALGIFRRYSAVDLFVEDPDPTTLKSIRVAGIGGAVRFGIGPAESPYYIFADAGVLAYQLRFDTTHRSRNGLPDSSKWGAAPVLTVGGERVMGEPRRLAVAFRLHLRVVALSENHALVVRNTNSWANDAADTSFALSMAMLFRTGPIEGAPRQSSR
jgi:hypothetical protein